MTLTPPTYVLATTHPKTAKAVEQVMSQGASLEHIDAVDAFARNLFVRARTSSEPLFAGVVTALRQLHIALLQLRIEAADPDSLLQSAKASIYTRQLRPIVQNCEHALEQLETILERWSVVPARDAEALAHREDEVTAVRSRLVSETMAVDTFLNTLQLHGPANNAPEVLLDVRDTSLEHIKDKVDNISKTLFLHRDTSGGTIADDDQMWQEFQSKLEMDGFSPHVLHQHKDILQAYIRELQSVSAANGGAPPTVTGLLEHEATMNSATPPVPPKEPLSPLVVEGPNEVEPSVDDEKYSLSIQGHRRLPDHASSLISSHDTAKSSPFPSPEGETQGSESSDSDGSLVLISTKDLVAMDDMTSLMHLHPAASCFTAAQQTGSSGNLVPSGKTGSWPPPSRLAAGQPLSTYSTSRSPPAPGDQRRANSPAVSSSPRTAARLAPDSHGNPIPMNAPWTKVKRSLISLEVLEKAGVRYEARPDYVAILGRLSREQLAEYARQSAICRAARSSLNQFPPSRTGIRNHSHPGRVDSKGSRDNNDDESAVWDEIDATDYDNHECSKGRKKSYSYPYIVNPPSESRTSPSTAVKPKPILKNKNENRVRFDPEPHEMEIRKSPRSYGDDSDDGDDDYDTHGQYRRRENRSRRPRDSRANDRRDVGGRSHDHRSSRHSDCGDREQRRDRRDRREERHTRRKTWGETIGVVGIGGAAASLLGVLAEAAVGM
ncbi:hypothetical protein E4U21_001127 [Claviceps maximensis]|nr:hypothetical protein E4U21_001127 [Claviceps maximensis]